MWFTLQILLFSYCINAELVCNGDTAYQSYLNNYGYEYKYDSTDIEYPE